MHENTVKAVSGLAIAWGVLLFQPASSAWAEPRKVVDRVPAFPVREIEEDGMVGVETDFHVAASPSEAFRVLSDVEHMAEFMPSLKACEVLERAGNTVVLRMTSDAGDLVQRRVHQPPGSIRWTLVSSPVLRRMHGSWHVAPEASGCRLTYRVVVESAVPAPAAMVRWTQQQALASLVKHVRARIESHGVWTKG